MSGGNPSRDSRRVSRWSRLTVWPTGFGEDIELSAPDPGRYAVDPAAVRRWTGAFDSEARANRMSVFVGDSLLPRPQTPTHRHVFNHDRVGNRTTWIVDEPGLGGSQIWAGGFAAEDRPSSMGRGMDRWLDDSEIEEEKRSLKEPPTEEQLAQADSALVSVDILRHQFEGWGTPDKPFLVKWIENDPASPFMFAPSKKWIHSMILALTVFMVAIASSGFSQGTDDIIKEFHVGQTVALLLTSLFVLGFAVGALILSPLSEVYGRRGLYVWTFAAFVLCSGATGLSPSIAAVLVFRLLAGITGSYTHAVAPAMVADMFQSQERGLVLSITTLSGMMGQMMGPVVCGFLNAAYGWRSLAIMIVAITTPTWLVLFFTFPETYSPTLLQRRADKLTKITGKAHAVEGLQQAKTIGTQLRVSTLRPWVILFFEPIVALLSLFLSVVHGTLFLLLAAYPIVFQRTRGWPQGVASLPFLAIALGIIISLIYIATVDQRRYARVVERCNGFAPPEARLPPAILGAAALPIGLFWFAWTDAPSVYWLVSVCAGVPIGFGMVLLYICLTNYLVDAYLGYAASALAASVVLRSVAGAVFPLFTTEMYNSLGIHWASSIPGFMALIFVPCLAIFYRFGHVIRRKSRFGQEAANFAEGMGNEDKK
ncbi:membrane transporter [Biscogniauxia marginata]|nr:membrane transporter [Biscogniauxia marginata]